MKKVYIKYNPYKLETNVTVDGNDLAQNSVIGELACDGTRLQEWIERLPQILVEEYNDERFVRRSEILWEKGTNRAEFFRGAVNKYGWVDMGSSFLPSEINAAFLWAQLENLEDIQNKRKVLWNQYFAGLQNLACKGFFRLPQIPGYASNNAHMFYIVCRNLEERSGLIAYLKEHGITAPFHYLSLHKSEYYQNHSEMRPELPNCDMFADCLVRLPMYYELSLEEVDSIVGYINEYFQNL